MKIKNSLLIIITTLIVFSIECPAQATNENTLTLKDAIQNALTNQPLLMQAEQQINASEAKIKQQKSFYYPEVAGDLSYTRIGPIPTIEFGGAGFTLAPSNNYDAHVSARQLLYDFGKRDALVNLAKSYKLSSEDKIGLIKKNLSYQTVKAFYAVLFLEKSIEVKNEQINTFNQHIELTTKKVQSGSATDFDILTTKVKLAAVKNQKIDLENSLAKARIYLKSLMGWPDNKNFIVSGNLQANFTPLNQDSLITEAFKQRPEMKLAQDAEKSADLSKHLASLADRPTLNLFVSYGFKNGYEPNLDVLRGNWAAGLSANIPIFDGNLKDAKVEEAEANIKSVSANILEIERNIKTDVRQAIADYTSNTDKFKTAKLQVDQAKQAVERAEIRYRDGVITNLDLIDAETSLSEAELLSLRVSYQNVINIYSLKEAIGEQIQ